MRGYSVLALCTILLQTEKTGPGGIPCELWPPGLDNPCLPPDPNPFFHFTVAMCLFVAFGVLYAYLTRAFQRERRTPLSQGEVRQWSEELSEALSVINDLRGLALRKKSITIVKGLLLSVDYTLQSVREYYVDCNPEEDDTLRCIAAIIKSGRALREQLTIIRIMLVLPPFARHAFRQTLKAVQQYKEFVELLKRCKADLPDLINTLPIFEF